MKTYSNYAIGWNCMNNHKLCRCRAAADTIDNISFAIVSDGDVDCKHSDLGAEFITNYVASKAKSIFERTIINNSNQSNMAGEWFIKHLEKKFDNYAYKIGAKYSKNLSCTLSFVITNGDEYVLLSIGNSPILIVYKDKTTRILTRDSEYVNDAMGITRLYPFSLTYKVGNMRNIDTIFICSSAAAESLIEDKSEKVSDIIFEDYKKYETNGDEIITQIRNNTLDDVSIAFIKNE